MNSDAPFHAPTRPIHEQEASRRACTVTVIDNARKAGACSAWTAAAASLEDVTTSTPSQLCSCAGFPLAMHVRALVKATGCRSADIPGILASLQCGDCGHTLAQHSAGVQGRQAAMLHSPVRASISGHHTCSNTQHRSSMSLQRDSFCFQARATCESTWSHAILWTDDISSSLNDSSIACLTEGSLCVLDRSSCVLFSNNCAKIHALLFRVFEKVLTKPIIKDSRGDEDCSEPDDEPGMHQSCIDMI